MHGKNGGTLGKEYRKPSYRSACAAILLVVAACITVAYSLLLPEAPGTSVHKKSGLVVDASNSDQGYIMVRRQSKKTQKLRITQGDRTMSYDLNSDGDYEVFPLQLGSGKYKIEVFEKVSGNKYTSAASVSFKVAIEDSALPFLYPNQYVNYDIDTLAIVKAAELCADATTEKQKVEAIYRFIASGMFYDYAFAMQVGSGNIKTYIPNVDDTLTKKAGVCFDFSALMACMLRSQGVATQLVIGYADKMYHAWNYVRVDGTWYQYDVTNAICQGSVKQYTPERVY